MVDGFLRFPGSVLLWHFCSDLLFPVSCLPITCSILFSFPAFPLKCRLGLRRQPQMPVSSDLRGPDCSRPVGLIVNCSHLTTGVILASHKLCLTSFRWIPFGYFVLLFSSSSYTSLLPPAFSHLDTNRKQVGGGVGEKRLGLLVVCFSPLYYGVCGETVK